MSSPEDILNAEYYNILSPYGFASRAKLWSRVRGRVSKAAFSEWLEAQRPYTLHKPARKNFRRNRIVVTTIDEQWQADLVDLQSLKKYNDGYAYLLTVIDCFSKYAWVAPMKSKKSAEVASVFESILSSSGRSPYKLQTESVGEFVGREFQNLLRKEGITFFGALNEAVKCAIVERWNRTLKTRMWRYFTHKNTRRYIDMLDSFMRAYNLSHHSSIKMRPVDVTADNILEVWHNLYGDPGQSETRYKFAINDVVRISKHKAAFEKGYEAAWSEETFTINSRQARDPAVYTIRDQNGEVVRGVFYERELQKVVVPDDTIYLVEKVIATRRSRGKKEYFVQWQGYAKSFNSWVPEEDITPAQ